MSIAGSRFGLLCLLCLANIPMARAQFAVIDVGAIAQLISQARTLEEQLSTARDTLMQAQLELRSLTGDRGMERLLAGTQRNYLPTSWADLESVLRGAGGPYGSLSRGVTDSLGLNAILPASRLSTLSPAQRQQVDTERRLDALLQALTRDALSATSGRFGSLQQLIDALPGAGDPKAVLDLQARVAAENAMLQNEQTKLQALYQVVQAEQRASAEQMRERVVAGHGQFAIRFQPSP